MGFFDKIVKNIAGDIVNGVVRNVENDASRKISNAVTNAAGNVANKTAEYAKDKAAEAEKNIDESAEKFRDNAVIERNTDTSDRLNFASKKNVKYNYKSPEMGTYFSFELNVVGHLTFPNQDSGCLVGDRHMANVLSNAIFRALQDVLTAYTIKGTAPDKLRDNIILITKNTNEKINSLCEEHGIHNHSLLFTILKPTDEAMERFQRNIGGNFGGEATPDFRAGWTCEFCGTTSTGDVCSGCGADRPN